MTEPRQGPDPKRSPRDIDTDQYVDELVAAAPMPSERQIARLRELLSGPLSARRL